MLADLAMEQWFLHVFLNADKLQCQAWKIEFYSFLNDIDMILFNVGFHAQFVLEGFMIRAIRTSHVFRFPMDHFDMSRDIAPIDSGIIAKIATITKFGRVIKLHSPVWQEVGNNRKKHSRTLNK